MNLVHVIKNIIANCWSAVWSQIRHRKKNQLQNTCFLRTKSSLKAEQVEDGAWTLIGFAGCPSRGGGARCALSSSEWEVPQIREAPGFTSARETTTQTTAQDRPTGVTVVTPYRRLTVVCVCVCVCVWRLRGYPLQGPHCSVCGVAVATCTGALWSHLSLSPPSFRQENRSQTVAGARRSYTHTHITISHHTGESLLTTPGSHIEANIRALFIPSPAGSSSSAATCPPVAQRAPPPGSPSGAPSPSGSLPGVP